MEKEIHRIFITIDHRDKDNVCIDEYGFRNPHTAIEHLLNYKLITLTEIRAIAQSFEENEE